MSTAKSNVPEAPTGAGKLLKADPIAEQFRSDIQKSIAAMNASPSARKPKLVGILAASASKPSETYAEFTRKTCEALGVEYVLKRVGDKAGAEGEVESSASEPVEEGQGAVEDAIVEANADDSVGGIMVRPRARIYFDFIYAFIVAKIQHIATSFVSARSTIQSLVVCKIITFSKLFRQQRMSRA